MVKTSPSDEVNRFAENLKKLLDKNRIKQNKLADMIGVSSGAISSYVKADKLPNIQTAALIANGLDVTLDQLYYGKLATDNSDFKIDNPKKFLLALTKLSEYAFLEIKKDNETDQFANTTTLTFCGMHIANFASDWKHVLELYKNGSINEEMKNILRDGLLKKYDDAVMDVDEDGTVMFESY